MKAFTIESSNSTIFSLEGSNDDIQQIIGLSVEKDSYKMETQPLIKKFLNYIISPIYSCSIPENHRQGAVEPDKRRNQSFKNELLLNDIRGNILRNKEGVKEFDIDFINDLITDFDKSVKISVDKE